jgi:hypothetical protein
VTEFNLVNHCFFFYDKGSNSARQVIPLAVVTPEDEYRLSKTSLEMLLMKNIETVLFSAENVPGT